MTWSSFSTHFLRGVFKSSVFNAFKNTIFIFNKCGNWESSFFSKPDIRVLHFFILQCRLDLEQIFIFVFMLKLPSSSLPENLQGAPIMKSQTLSSSNSYTLLKTHSTLKSEMNTYIYVYMYIFPTNYSTSCSSFFNPTHPFKCNLHALLFGSIYLIWSCAAN